MPSAAAQERVPGLVDQRGHVGGLGVHRQRARLDAPHVQQIADQAVHVVGLLLDDPEELPRLRRVHHPRSAERGGGRALDRGKRRPQLVAHHAQELRPLPLQLLKGREILHGDHHRGDRPVPGMDGRDVHQGLDAAPVRERERDLLGAHRLGAAELLRQRVLGKRDLAPVGPPADDRPEQVLRGGVRRAQALDDAPRLAVERHRTAGRGIEDHHADRRGLDQGLQVRPGPLLGPMGARIADRGRGLRGEQHQHFLVLLGEHGPAFLLAEKKVPHMDAAMAHRGGLQGL